MKKIQIFEPAMCCETGLCGVHPDPELMRISHVLNVLRLHFVKVGRFNLSSAPEEFAKNETVRAFLEKNGPEGLPLVLLDGEPVLSGRYPTNAELTKLLGLPQGMIPVEKENKPSAPPSGGSREGGCC